MLFSDVGSGIPELSELQKINTIVKSGQGDIPSIKTNTYSLYFVPDPHQNGIKIFLKKFFLKNSLMLDSSHQVFEMKVALTFNEYVSRRNKFLSALGNDSEFAVKKPRARDILAGLLERKILKEIASGKKMAVAFYKGTKGCNYLKFSYTDMPRTGICLIYKSLKKLLLAQPPL